MGYHGEWYPDGFNSIIREAYTGSMDVSKLWNPASIYNPSIYNQNKGGSSLKIKVTRTKLITALQVKKTALEESIKPKEINQEVKKLVDQYEKDINKAIKGYQGRVELLKTAKTVEELTAACEKTRGLVEWPNLPWPKYLPAGDPYIHENIKAITSLIVKLELTEEGVLELDDNDPYLRYL